MPCVYERDALDANRSIMKAKRWKNGSKIAFKVFKILLAQKSLPEMGRKMDQLTVDYESYSIAMIYNQLL